MQVHQLWSLFQSKEPRHPDHRCDVILIDINYIGVLFFLRSYTLSPSVRTKRIVEHALHNMCVDMDAVMNMDMGMEMVMDMGMEMVMDMDTFMDMMNGCPRPYP